MIASLVAAVAVVRGGSLENLAQTRFGWIWVLIAALVIQIGTDILGYEGLARPLAALLLAITYLGAAVFLALNRSLPGMAIAASGMMLNAIVILANGAMPVSLWAARVAGIDELGDLGVKHEVAGPDTALPFLADVIPIPNALQIISFGDVVLGVGIAVLVYRQTARPSARASLKRVSG